MSGLSVTAVSMALRNRPRISVATRERVQRLAAETGYRPDPETTRLMLHLRRRREGCAVGTSLAAFTDWPAREANVTLDALTTAARHRAESQGHSLEIFRVPEEPRHLASLKRVLITRGVQGLLLLPLMESRSLEQILDWQKFSVVATSHSVTAPAFHQVVPHYFENARLAYERLADRGFRRIGLAIRRTTDQRTGHGYSAAHAWHQQSASDDPVAPLIVENITEDAWRCWLAAERPDIVFCDSGIPPGSERGPANPQFISIAAKSPSVPWLDERPDEVAAFAVDLLARMVLRSEKGIPSSPTITLLPGRWVEAG